MKIRIYFMSFTLIILSSGICKSQDNSIEIELENKQPSYISITEVFVGPSSFFKNPEDDYYAGFKHRAIVTTSEIYSSLYFDKISLDIEGGTMEILWSKRVDLKSILDIYHLSAETTTFDNFTWDRVDSFTFCLDEIKFYGVLCNGGNRISIYKVNED